MPPGGCREGDPYGVPHSRPSHDMYIMRQPFAFRSLSFRPHLYALSLQGVRGHGALAEETLGEQRHNAPEELPGDEP